MNSKRLTGFANNTKNPDFYSINYSLRQTSHDLIEAHDSEFSIKNVEVNFNSGELVQNELNNIWESFYYLENQLKEVKTDVW